MTFCGKIGASLKVKYCGTRIIRQRLTGDGVIVSALLDGSKVSVVERLDSLGLIWIGAEPSRKPIPRPYIPWKIVILKRDDVRKWGQETSK